MAAEGTDMKQPSWLQNNINLGNIPTLAGMLTVFAFGYGSISEKIASMERFRSERTVQTDEKFAAITRALENLPNLSYRVTAQEEALKATNARVDISLNNISARLAEINQALGGLDTKVAVLTQRLETAAPGRRASLDPLRP